MAPALPTTAAAMAAATTTAGALAWQWSAFDELRAADVYALLSLRQEVFVVEQQCIFPDIDWHDQNAHHLLGWQSDAAAPDGRRLAAYLRCLPPGEKFAECSIGRVVTSPAARGTGLGRLLVAQGLARLEGLYPGQPARIGAQLHLERFYGSFGFVAASAPYDEDNIMHVEMLRPAR